MYTYIIHVCIRARVCCVIYMCVCLHECLYFMFNGCIYVYIYYSCMHSRTCMLRNIYVCMVTRMFTFYVLLVYVCIHILFMYAIAHVYVEERARSRAGECRH